VRSHTDASRPGSPPTDAASRGGTNHVQRSDRGGRREERPKDFSACSASSAFKRRPFSQAPEAHVAAMAAVLTAVLSVGAAAVQQESAQPKAASPGRSEIARAIAAVKADPNLATERTIKTLRWQGSTESTPSGLPTWLTWTAGLFRWLEQSARLLVWGAVVALAGWLIVYIVGTMGRHGVLRMNEPFVAPSHVRDLDIRPESLPKDIGIAARGLWDRGEHRAALALLYRGMLSRLAHVHGIPIRDSSTEGDCLALAASRLTQRGREYASRLVRVWQPFVYGGQDTQAATVYILCDEFASALDSASPLDSLRSGGGA